MRVRALNDVFLGLTGGFRTRGEVFHYNGPANRHLVPVPEEVPLSNAPTGPSVPLPRPLTTPEQEMAEMGALAPGLKKFAPELPPGYVPDPTLPPPPRALPAAPPAPPAGALLNQLAEQSAVQAPAEPVPQPAASPVTSVRLPPTATPIDASDLLG